jgi:oligoendopeptidase F
MTWDLTSYFPDFHHPDRERFQAELDCDLCRLMERARALGELTAATFGAWEQVVLDTEGIGARLEHLRSFVKALASVEGSNRDYRAGEAECDRLAATFEAIDAHLQRGCGSAEQAVFDLWLARPALAGAEYALSRLRHKARASMPVELEELAAELSTDGIKAWGRLYDSVTSALTFEMQHPDGTTETLPISARRSLMEGADRAVREGAWRGGNRAFEQHADTLAAALNHIAGTRLTLNRRRGVKDSLEPALFQSGISRATLDAMYEAVERQIELPRRVLRLKACAMGRERLAWFDLGAPLETESPQTLDWEAAQRMVGEAFGAKYPALGEFYRTALEKNWVEWTPRPGKRSGAYCTSSPLLEQSRVFMTFGGTLSDVSTLAHEIGHAFHGHLMSDLRGFARHYPMTLAETASTFAELVLAHGGQDGAAAGSAVQRSTLRHNLVNDAATFLLDITVRFRFERAFYEQRAAGELSAERLGELMAQTQLDVLGPTLDPGGSDPLYWASKLHFFITGVSFYNYPYTFGYLLSRGLYAEFEQQGPQFLPRYEAFLRRTGSASAEVVAKETLGCDLEQPEFWERSILSLSGELARLELEFGVSSPPA